MKLAARVSALTSPPKFTAAIRLDEIVRAVKGKKTIKSMKKKGIFSMKQRVLDGTDVAVLGSGTVVGAHEVLMLLGVWMERFVAPSLGIIVLVLTIVYSFQRMKIQRLQIEKLEKSNDAAD